MAIILHTDGQDDKYFESSQRNVRLQAERCGTRALPYYVLLDPTGKKVYDERGGVFDVDEFVEFLRQVPTQ